MVTVVNASAMDFRDFAAALGHLVSTYETAWSSHGTSRALDSGRTGALETGALGVAQRQGDGAGAHVDDDVVEVGLAGAG
jgi:hypothetical protein